jgi:riboflavin kinase/FMN adenylyltransferase
LKVIHDPAEIELPGPDRLAATIGNFDGVHRGHERVLSELRAGAASRHAFALAVTFDPHPDSVLGSGARRTLLTPSEEKAELVARAGLDALLVARFTRETACLEAGDFLSWIGVGRGSHLVVGYDFRMGSGRACDTAELARLGSEVGYGLDVVPPVEFEGGPISSSRIRDALASGDVQSAAAMLGRPYVLKGRVVAGEGIGGLLGTRTANLDLPADKLLPADGVYFVTADTLGGRPGLLYVGKRPTLGPGERRAEVHVLDLDADLRDRVLGVGIHRRLRDDVRFESTVRLKEEIVRDIARARGLAESGAGSVPGSPGRCAFSF